MSDTTKLKVDGMTCSGCVSSVTKALSQVPGVEQVEVSLERAEAVVRHDPAKAPVAALRGAVEDAGFDVG